MFYRQLTNFLEILGVTIDLKQCISCDGNQILEKSYFWPSSNSYGLKLLSFKVIGLVNMKISCMKIYFASKYVILRKLAKKIDKIKSL